MAGRYFFHLINRHTVIPDRSGVEADNLAIAQRAAMDIIAEFRADSLDDDGLRDWMMVVTDETDRFALVLPLCP